MGSSSTLRVSLPRLTGLWLSVLSLSASFGNRGSLRGDHDERLPDKPCASSGSVQERLREHGKALAQRAWPPFGRRAVFRTGSNHVAENAHRNRDPDACVSFSIQSASAWDSRISVSDPGIRIETSISPSSTSLEERKPEPQTRCPSRIRSKSTVFPLSSPDFQRHLIRWLRLISSLRG